MSNRTNGLIDVLGEVADLRVLHAVEGDQLRERVRACAQGRPPSSGRFVAAGAQVARLVDEWRPDVVHADTLALVPSLSGLPPSVLRLASLNDSYGLFTAWLASQAGSPLDRFNARLRAEVARRSEAAACRAADLIHVLSIVDAVDLRSRGVSAEVDVVPNGVWRHNRSVGLREVRPVVVFHGALGGEHRENLLILVRRIWPVILAAVPSATLHIIGSGAPPEVADELRSSRGVVFKGFVPDLLPELQEAMVGVVPVSKPNGQSTKALDLLAAGVALCADPAVAGGIPELRNGVNALLTTASSGFAQSVIRLLCDTSLREGLAVAGHAVATNYSWERARDRYLGSIESAIARKAGLPS